MGLFKKEDPLLPKDVLEGLESGDRTREFLKKKTMATEVSLNEARESQRMMNGIYQRNAAKELKLRARQMLQGGMLSSAYLPSINGIRGLL